jgi:predicted  nucleic acid-binding Zn-ribbon protein
VRVLEEEIAKAEARLAEDPEVAELTAKLADAQSIQHEIAARLRKSELERKDHQAKLHTREKELMSGRIRNPTELMQMSDEVSHMKTRFAEEEEAEFTLMEEAEAADRSAAEAGAALEAAKQRAQGEEPAIRAQLDQSRSDLEATSAERDDVWSQVPAESQAAYKRVRIHPAVTLVSGSQCSVCRVTVTSSGLQVLRKGDNIVHCDNCGRILVMA